MRYALGVDVGGSTTKIALVSEQGQVLAEETVPTLDSADAVAILMPWAEAVDRLRALAARRALPVVALGCGIPGYLDATRTYVELNNIRALERFALAPWLRERLGLPVSLDNDACMAAIAETTLAPVHDARRVLFVTVGSGIGVVLVVDGAVVRVIHGVTGDAAHIIVDHASPERCPVGCRGCLETVASARAIARMGTHAARDGSSRALAETLSTRGEVTAADVSAAASGEAAAAAIIREAGRWLGVGLASWAPLYAPDLILVGGGVAQAGVEWLGAAARTMRESGLPFFVEKVQVRPATLGTRAGVIGAALVAMQETTGPALAGG